MASNYCAPNPTTNLGSQLINALSHLKQGVDYLNEALRIIDQIRDGDTSDPAHYDPVVIQYGYTDNVCAQSSYNEISSLMGKLNATGATSVDHVLDAIQQCLAKHGL